MTTSTVYTFRVKLGRTGGNWGLVFRWGEWGLGNWDGFIVAAMQQDKVVLHLPVLHVPRKRTHQTTAKKKTKAHSHRRSQTYSHKRTPLGKSLPSCLLFTSQLLKLPALHPGYLRLPAANLASRDCIFCCALSDSWACRRPSHFHRFRANFEIPKKNKRHLYNISWRCDILWCMCCISGVPRLSVQLLHQITGVLLLQALGQSCS